MQLWRQAFLEATFTWMWVTAAILLGAEKSMWGTSLRGRADIVNALLQAVMFLIYIQVGTIIAKKHDVIHNGRIVFTGDQRGPDQFPSFNPAVTLLQVLQGAQGPLAGLLFIGAQCLGAILGALCAKELLPQEQIDRNLLGGCFGQKFLHRRHAPPDNVGLSDHQYFLVEFMFSFTFLYAVTFLSTPKQVRELKLKWVVVLIASNIGFNVYLSSAFGPGYSGSMFNPARCLGPAVAYGQPLWERLWPAFTAPFVAAFPVAFVYALVPPEHAEMYATKEDLISRFLRWYRELSRSPPDSTGDFKSASTRIHDMDLESNGTGGEVDPSNGKVFSSGRETLDVPDIDPPPTIVQVTV